MVNPQLKTSFPGDTVGRSKILSPFPGAHTEGIWDVVAKLTAGAPSLGSLGQWSDSSLCDSPKRDLCQRAVIAGDPIGRVTVIFFHASDGAVNAAERIGRRAWLGDAARRSLR